MNDNDPNEQIDLGRRNLMLKLPLGIAACYSLFNSGNAESAVQRRKSSKTPRKRKPEYQSPNISQSLEDILNNQMTIEKSSGHLPSDVNLSIVVYDHDLDPINAELASINGDAKTQAASMIKPFVALAYLEKFWDSYKDDSNARLALERMIQHSDNVYTNWIMQKVGGPVGVQNFLNSNYSGIFKNTEIIDYIPLTDKEVNMAKSLKLVDVPSGSSYYSNLTSAQDYSRFLYALWNKTINPEISGEILRLMSLEKEWIRVKTGIPAVPKDTVVYDKTGTTARVYGDAALMKVVHNGGSHTFSFVGVFERPSPYPNYKRWKAKCGHSFQGMVGTVVKYVEGLHHSA